MQFSSCNLQALFNCGANYIALREDYEDSSYKIDAVQEHLLF
jgi:hypothetical protein